MHTYNSQDVPTQNSERLHIEHSKSLQYIYTENVRTLETTPITYVGPYYSHSISKHVNDT